MRVPIWAGVPVLTVLAGLAATAYPAAAHADISVRTCDLAVCETVTALPPPQLTVGATATPGGQRCGHFTMTVTRPNGVVLVRNSAQVCSLHPAATFNLAMAAPLPPGTTIAMQFVSNPPTPGRPVIRV
jgi:hypothetical protein